MQGFENSPEALVIKGVLREFFLGILDNIKGAFLGLVEWVQTVPVKAPPLLKVFGNAKINTVLFAVVTLYIILINIRTYRLFEKDKEYAQDDEWRISEGSLLLSMWLGGALGGFLAIYRLRHKTKKKTFTITAKVLVIAQLLLYSFIVGFLGFWAFF